MPPEDVPYSFNNYYEDLNYRIDYSEGLLIADKFIQDLYVHMGFQPAWKYEKVIERSFTGRNRPVGEHGHSQGETFRGGMKKW